MLVIRESTVQSLWLWRYSTSSSKSLGAGVGIGGFEEPKGSEDGSIPLRASTAYKALKLLGARE